MFDLSADWPVIAETLCSDPTLGRLAQGEEGLRVPGCWNTFELATRAILDQQTTLKRARNCRQDGERPRPARLSRFQI